ETQGRLPVGPRQVMKLHTLDLKDFRGFEASQLTFHPSLTVLVGINGSGKTSVLDAIVRLLLVAERASLRARVGGRQPVSRSALVDDDIRGDRPACEISLVASIDEEPFHTMI